MSPAIASVIFAAGILGLFWLDRDSKVRMSGAIWIPLIWLFFVCSRPVGTWLDMGPVIDTANQMQEGSPLDRLVWLALLVLGLVVLARRNRLVVKFLVANWPLLLFFLFCAVSILWSDFPDVAFKRWLKAVGDVVMVLIVLTDPEPVAAFNRVIARLTYFLIPLSILFIKYYPTIGLSYSPWGGRANYGGVTTNKNSLGVISLCFGIWAWWRLLAAYKDRKRAGWIRKMIAPAVILAMVLWLFKTSDSMTSFTSFLMAGILLVATGSRIAIRKRALVHILIVSMLAVSGSVVFFGASPSALKAMGRDSTLTDRTEIWAAVSGMVKNPLVGTGFESFWLGPRLEDMWSRYWWHPQEAHNGYLEIYLALGWIGVGLLIFVIAMGYRTVFSAWRHNAPTGSLMLAYFLIGLVYNFTEAAFFKMQAVAWMFFLFAIIKVPSLSYRRARASFPKLVEHPDWIVEEEAVALADPLTPGNR